MKPGRLIIILFFIALGVVIYLNKCSSDKPAAAQGGGGQKQPMMVNGIIVTTEEIDDNIFASGTLIASEEVEIRNEIAGKITSLVFKEGTRVSKGQVLLTIYDDDLLAQLKKLESQKEIAQKTEERQKDLLTINGISQQEYEISANELSSIKADIDLIHSQLSKTKITAPFDGIIGLKTVSTGAYIPINTRIATIQEVDPLKLEFALPEKYRSMIVDNTEINFTTESSAGIFKGKIYAFEPKIDLQTRSVMVRALCSNKENKLYPGAFAHIEIPLRKINKAILIPTQSLVPELKGQKVFIVKKGLAEKVPVETGMRNDSAIQIISGLNEGDTILTSGLMQMRPGMPLSVTVNSK